MSSPPPSPEDECLRLLGHELQTVLAGVSGHAQLLQRQLRRASGRDAEQYVNRLDGMIKLIWHGASLVALLQSGEWRAFEAEETAGSRDGGASEGAG